MAQAAGSDRDATAACYAVLHVDPDPETRASTARSLGADPAIALRSCASCDDALAAAARWRPDVVLVDVDHLDRDDAVGRLAAAPHTADVPVILLTAKPAADRPLPARAAAVVTKADDPAQLRGRVRATVEATILSAYRGRAHAARELAGEAALALGIVESSDDGIVAKDLDGKILLWNAGAERLSKFTAAEIVGRNMREVIPADRLSFEDDVLAQVTRGRSLEPYETQRLQKDGRRIDVAITVSPIRDRNGTLIGTSSIARDITRHKATAAALRHSRQRGALAVQGMSVGVWDLDLAADTLEWSDRLKDMLDLPHDFQPTPPDFAARLHPDDRDRASARLQAHFDERAPYDIEYRLRREDGDYIWVRSAGQAAWDEDRRPVRMVGSIEDISARKATEANLRRMNESLEQQVVARTAQMRAIIDAIPGMVAYWDKNLYCSFANVAYLEWFGWRPEDLVGATMQSLLGDDLFARNEPFVRAALAGERQVFERTLTKQDGSIGHTLAHYIPHRGDGAEVLGFFVLVTDVTPLRDAQARVNASEARYRLLAEHSSDMIFQVNRDFVRTYVSPACRDILGYAEDDLIGRQPFDAVHPDDAERVAQAYHAVRDGETEHCTLEKRVWHRDGRWIWVEATIRAYRDPDGRFDGVVGALRDITDRKAIERQIALRSAALEAANRELDAFAHVASHDLKAPLRVIDNASQWLQEDLEQHLTADTRDSMNLLRGRVRRMEKLLDDLLAFSRIGRGDDRAEIVDGRTLVDDVLALLAPPAAFTVAVDPGFAAIRVARMPLQQILMNLIGNAIKHHDKAAGRITVTVTDHGTHHAFAVGDDGPGIPARYHEQVFRMFQTLKPRDQVEGSGMGLAIVRKQVETCGGTLSLESSEGNGSVFRFTLPTPSSRLDLAS